MFRKLKNFFIPKSSLADNQKNEIENQIENVKNHLMEALKYYFRESPSNPELWQKDVFDLVFKIDKNAYLYDVSWDTKSTVFAIQKTFSMNTLLKRPKNNRKTFTIEEVSTMIHCGELYIKPQNRDDGIKNRNDFVCVGKPNPDED